MASASSGLLYQPAHWRAFANIDFEAIKPANSCLKVYNELVESKQIRADPKQLAVMNILDKWQQNFISEEPRIREYQEEYLKVADFGQNAKKLKKKGAGKFHSGYNTEMHTTMGRRDLDPQ